MTEESSRERKKNWKREDYERLMDDMLRDPSIPFTIIEIGLRLGFPPGSKNVSTMFNHHAERWKKYREKLVHMGTHKRLSRERKEESQLRQSAVISEQEQFQEFAALV